MQPLVSIIIPTYNRAYLLGDTLDSVLSQTYTNWECIIIDDGSSDHTEEVVSAYLGKDHRFRYYFRPEYHKKGASGARNYGLKMSQGEFIQWFDSDDIMDNNFLKLKMDCFDIHIGADVVFGGFGYFDNKGIQNRKSNMYFSGDILEDFVNGKITFSPLSFILKKKVIKDYVFDEALRRYEDVDFFFRVFSSQKRLKIVHISEVLFLVRKHPLSLSSNDDQKGLLINSQYIVHRKILDNFYIKKNQKGVDEFTKKCLYDIKSLLRNKNYQLAIFNIIKLNHLKFNQKGYLLFYAFTFFLSGKGINRITKI